MIIALSRLCDDLTKVAAAIPDIPGLTATGPVVDSSPHGTEGRLNRPAVPGPANKRKKPRTKHFEPPRAYGPRLMSKA